MARVVRTRTEFEGEIREELAVIQDDDVESWPEGAALGTVGRPATRLEGMAKVTGSARYTQDLRFPGMLHARIVRSAYARARVRRVDASQALALPGVRSVLHRFNAPKSAQGGKEPLFRDEVRFVGDEVAAICAESAETADEALRLVAVEYEVLPHVADLEEAIADTSPRLAEKGNVALEGTHERGDAAKALREADHSINATYRTSTQLHNSLETHSSVATWDGGLLTLYDSTQSIFDVRQDLHRSLDLPLGKIRVICEHMGGGFGSKGHLYKQGIIAALFSRELRAPVRCVLDRHEENIAVGNRSATLQRVRVGVKDGRITAIAHDSWSNVGQGRWVADPTGPTKGLYEVPNVVARSYKVVTTTGGLAAFRAPGYVEGTFALESAIDEVADAAGIDPLELRRRHAGSDRDPMSDLPYSLKRLIDCYDIGAKEIRWSRRERGGHRGSAPGLRRGLGMASQLWGGSAYPPAYATVHVEADGHAVARVGTQDIGTGTRTLIAQVVAEELGIELDAVRVDIGDTDAPYAPISAGSVTVSTVMPAVRLAARDAREQLLDIAAGVMEAPKAELRIERGSIRAKGAVRAISKIFEDLQNYTVIGKGSRLPNPEDLSVKTFGAHFAEIEVDLRSGEITVLKVVAVHDIGRVINPLTARSQVEGGVIQAIGYALMEERIVDIGTGHVLTTGLDTYKVPTVKDVPEIVVRFVDVPDTRAGNTGAKGLGEPPIIPTAAAVANAVANATGVRFRSLPLTRKRILDGLAAAVAR